MAESEFLRFLGRLRADPQMLAAYRTHDLSRLTFHARNSGFDFTEDEAATVVGTLETRLIIAKDGEAVDGHSRLWRHMWGRHYLEYIVRHVVERYSDDELRTPVSAEGRPGA